MEARTPSALDNFLFDLNGYLVLKNVVDADLLARLNAAFDAFPPLEYGEWWGNAMRRDYNGATGFELHNCVEAGAPFEELIDHPGWINYVRHYCGEENSYVAGLFIDECIASIRRSGGHHPVHSGGFRAALRNKYLYEHGVLMQKGYGLSAREEGDFIDRLVSWLGHTLPMSLFLLLRKSCKLAISRVRSYRQ